MVKSNLLCCVFLISSVTSNVAQSRKDSLMMERPFFGEPFFYQDSVVLSHDAVVSLMKTNLASYKEFRKAYLERNISAAAKTLGLWAVFFGSIEGIHWTSLAESSVFLISGISASKAFTKHSNNALSIYNRSFIPNNKRRISWDGNQIEIGPYIPLGKELKYAYVVGWRLNFGPRILFGKLIVTPEVNLDMTLNHVRSKDVTDNLVTHGVLLKTGYKVMSNGIKIEPFVGAGFLKSANFLTQPSADFTGGYFSKTVDLLSLEGAAITFGFTIDISNNVSAGANYQFFRPAAILSQEAQTNVPYNNSTSQLYGKLIEFNPQKMNLDNLHFQLKIKI